MYVLIFKWTDKIMLCTTRCLKNIDIVDVFSFLEDIVLQIGKPGQVKKLSYGPL